MFDTVSEAFSAFWVAAIIIHLIGEHFTCGGELIGPAYSSNGNPGSGKTTVETGDRWGGTGG